METSSDSNPVTLIAQENQTIDIDTNTSNPSSRPQSIRKIVSLFLSGLLLIGLGIGLGYLLPRSKNPSSQPLPNNSIPTEVQPQPSNLPLEATNSASANITAVTLPQKYGFTNLQNLTNVDAQAKFTPSTKLTLENKSVYEGLDGGSTVRFELADYDGGGRRAWFISYLKSPDQYTFLTFATNSHSGYIAYLADNPSSPGAYFYFTPTSATKMLLITGLNDGNGTYFGGDLEKFKSFLSTVKILSQPDVQLESFSLDTYRASPTLKTVWQNPQLGLKITTPEWVEFKFGTQRDIQGKVIYSDWQRTNIESTETPVTDPQSPYTTTVSISTGMTPSTLKILSTQYNQLSADQIAKDLMIGSGFCSTGWTTDKNKCSDPNNYCYTQDEVAANIEVKSQVKVGNLDAMLVALNQNFSIQNDCRSSQQWIIKAKNGQFVVTDLSPNSSIESL